MALIPPPPIKEGNFPFVWQQWFRQIRDNIQSGVGSIPWSSVSKSGSNLNELTTRQHDQLQSISGGGTYHLSSTEYGNLLSTVQRDNVVLSQASYTVATLPAGSLGKRTFVTDATVTTFATIVAGTGANTVPVYHDGTNWMIG